MTHDDTPDAAEIEEHLRTSNLRTWLEFQAVKLGDDNQRARYAAGALPLEELLALARAELYRPLEAWPRWKNRDLHAREVKHENTCAGAENAVKYRTLGGVAMPPMDAASWDKLVDLRHAVNKIAVHDWLTRSHAKVEVAVTRHEAWCTRCRKSVARYAAKVSVPWAGHTLVREYAL